MNATLTPSGSARHKEVERNKSGYHDGFCANVYSWNSRHPDKTKRSNAVKP